MGRGREKGGMMDYDRVMILGVRQCRQCFGGIAFKNPSAVQSLADAGYMGSDFPDKTGACPNPDCRNGWIHEELTESDFDEYRRRRDNAENDTVGGFMKFLFGKKNKMRDLVPDDDLRKLLEEA